MKCSSKVATNEKRKAIEWKQRKRGSPRGNLSSFLRQKKKLKEKEGNIEHHSTERYSRDRKERREACLSMSFPVSSPPLSSRLFRATTNFSTCFSKPFRCFYLWKLNSPPDLSMVAFFFVNTLPVFVRNKHPRREVTRLIPS